MLHILQKKWLVFNYICLVFIIKTHSGYVHEYNAITKYNCFQIPPNMYIKNNCIVGTYPLFWATHCWTLPLPQWIPIATIDFPIA